MAFEVVKAMQVDGLGWGEGYRPLGRQALAEIIQGRMAETVDDWLDSLDGMAMRDRRNGSYSRQLLTELGNIALSVPRTRRFCPSAVLKSYARRAPEIDRAILTVFVLGLSSRKVGEVLLALLGRPVSASTVSRVAKALDAAVAAFHARPHKDAYKALVLDGVVLARRTGAGALKRPVPVALGIKAVGKKEIVDFASLPARVPPRGSASSPISTDAGFTGDGLETICADGGQDFMAALPTAYPGIPLQRCWAHKIRNVLDKVRKPGRDTVKADLHAVMNAPSRPMGTLQDRTSMDRILFAVFIHEDKSQGASTPFSLTRKS